MASKTDLPRNDDQIERHQFYARIAATTDNNSHDIDGIGKKVTALVASHEKVRDSVKHAGTTVKTIVGASIFIWSLIGGAVGLYVQHTIASYEQFISKVDILEKKALAQDAILDNLKDIPAKVAALKITVSEHQTQIDNQRDKPK